MLFSVRNRSNFGYPLFPNQIYEGVSVRPSPCQCVCPCVGRSCVTFGSLKRVFIHLVKVMRACVYMCVFVHATRRHLLFVYQTCLRLASIVCLPNLFEIGLQIPEKIPLLRNKVKFTNLSRFLHFSCKRGPFKMRPRISIRGCVHPLVHPSISPSVCHAQI